MICSETSTFHDIPSSRTVQLMETGSKAMSRTATLNELVTIIYSFWDNYSYECIIWENIRVFIEAQTSVFFLSIVSGNCQY